VQPSFGRRRRIGRELRAEPQLVHDRLSDPILVTRAKAGDKDALAALCRRHVPRVERITRHVLGDTPDAADAAQEALAKLCTRLGQFRGEAAFTTWLHRLTVNACRDVAERRLRERCEPLPDDLGAATEPVPSRAAELAELRGELRAGLAELPAAQARVVVLKDALGFSFEEISTADGMPVGTAKCYAHRARAGLRETLSKSETLSVDAAA
jgi:RNA polymerase sigma-70 factor, ECF subfamily